MLRVATSWEDFCTTTADIERVLYELLRVHQKWGRSLTRRSNSFDGFRMVEVKPQLQQTSVLATIVRVITRNVRNELPVWLVQLVILFRASSKNVKTLKE